MPPCASGLDGPIPSAPPGTAAASTSPSSPSTPRRSSCACSTRRPTNGSRTGSRCPSRPTRSGTPTCPTCGPASSTAIASTARTRRRRAIASIRNKVLLDPYAKAIGRELRLGRRAVRLHARATRRRSRPFDDRDSAAVAPLAAVIDAAFTWGDDRPPRTPWHKTVIYEVHVKGFTKPHPGVPEPRCAAPTPASRPTRRSSI